MSQPPLSATEQLVASASCVGEMPRTYRRGPSAWAASLASAEPYELRLAAAPKKQAAAWNWDHDAFKTNAKPAVMENLAPSVASSRRQHLTVTDEANRRRPEESAPSPYALGPMPSV